MDGQDAKVNRTAIISSVKAALIIAAFSGQAVADTWFAEAGGGVSTLTASIKSESSELDTAGSGSWLTLRAGRTVGGIPISFNYERINSPYLSQGFDQNGDGVDTQQDAFGLIGAGLIVPMEDLDIKLSIGQAFSDLDYVIATGIGISLGVGVPINELAGVELSVITGNTEGDDVDVGFMATRIGLVFGTGW